MKADLLGIKKILRDYPVEEEQMDEFYQSKFSQFAIVSYGTAILTVFANFMYFFTDCQIFGRFAYETLLPRLSILLPLALVLLLPVFTRDYHTLTSSLYLIPHAAMWSTVWAIYYLPNRDFAREGFIIMQFSFLAIGMAAPIKTHIELHSLYIVDIILSNALLHYKTFWMMLTLSVPVYIGICIVLFFIELVNRKLWVTEQKLDNKSKRDNLTQIYNRNMLNDLVYPGTYQFRWEDETWCLMFDIDHFKKVNDVYGHEIGDEVLKMCVENVHSMIRKSDYFIRYGGEEFVIFLIRTNREQVMNIAERIRRGVEESKNGITHVTISVGFAPYKDDYMEAIKHADQALFFVKENGRNAVGDYEVLCQRGVVGDDEVVEPLEPV